MTLRDLNLLVAPFQVVLIYRQCMGKNEVLFHYQWKNIPITDYEIQDISVNKDTLYIKVA